MTESLKQPITKPVPFYKIAALMQAWWAWCFDSLPAEKVWEFEDKLYEKLDTIHKDFAKEIQKNKWFDEEVKVKLIEIAKEVEKEMLAELQ
jgi:F0F1-type ATP synthase alpha subunit